MPGPLPSAALPDARDFDVTTHAPVVQPGDDITDFATFRDCVICPDLFALPEGVFHLGSLSTEIGRDEDEDTVQGAGGAPLQVNIPKSFVVGRFEITVEEWQACADGGSCREAFDAFDALRRPVVNVGWRDITGQGVPERGFIAWMNSKVEGSPYRLLSEAEWEYAARGGTTSAYSTGETIITAQANFRDDTCLEQTVSVGSYAANPFGLYDMHGNVWEWCADVWHESYAGDD